MSEKYCPAGRVECNQCTVRNQKWYCLANNPLGSLGSGTFEVCPWPSRQQPIEQKPTIAESYIAADAYARGRADMKRECVEKIKQITKQCDLGDVFELLPEDWDKPFPLILHSDAIAAIESIEVNNDNE